MKSAVTLCLVREAAAGPFVFHDPLEVGFQKAAAAGFDAVELFLPGPDAVEIAEIQSLQEKHGLAIAAVGTGAGMVKHGLSVTDPDPAKRQAALEFIRSMVDFGARLGAPAILGSMQGRAGAGVSREQARDWLYAALLDLGRQAAGSGVSFIYEPLNRNETNLFNHAAPATDFLHADGLEGVVLLADLFHMAIEERDIADGLREMGDRLGHVHWADSNRQAMGFGHTDPAPITAALREIGYAGYLSAEVFPQPDAETAAGQTIASIKAALG